MCGAGANTTAGTAHRRRSRPNASRSSSLMIIRWLPRPHSRSSGNKASTRGRAVILRTPRIRASVRWTRRPKASRPSRFRSTVKASPPPLDLHSSPHLPTSTPLASTLLTSSLPLLPSPSPIHSTLPLHSFPPLLTSSPPHLLPPRNAPDEHCATARADPLGVQRDDGEPSM